MQIIIFILNSLTGCSMHIQTCSMRIQNTPRSKHQHEIFPVLALFFKRQHGGTKGCSIRIQNALGVAQSVFKVRLRLLYFTVHIGT
jgi:hypothetical protein